ncbi:hypothetical protein HO173_000534 [Letharia columbiana]|uniref:Uncharacterized protein n=1 Tax=Letharia columbiana TaxID=112416 RepID=A0A8H6G786_9LECA|nr:uncharacterized protein HO173_000534 [Letharia columbiana]KAF6241822.1 hypothetical protein HO173_000534 [Letharia columbiana]
MLLTFSLTMYVHDRIEHWVHEAIKGAYNDASHHRRSETIRDSISPDDYITWLGDEGEQAMDSTDLRITPERNLTWGMFSDCLPVINWFVSNYPEWDFWLAIEVAGVAGNLGECWMYTR